MKNNNLTINYIICPECKNILDMSFVGRACSNPLCLFNFEGLRAYLDKDNGELYKALRNAQVAKNDHEFRLIITAIRFNMPALLAEFISYSWGSQIQRLFKDFIKNYLNDFNALKMVLKSNVIKSDKNNTIISKNGYKMFWDLYKWLMRVHSPQIRDFLRKEFPDFYKKYYKEQHEKFMRPKITAKNEDQVRLV